MAETFFTQIEDDTIRALLNHTTLHNAALIIVGSSLHIERLNERGAQLTGLHPLERIDQILSPRATVALKDCIADHLPRTIEEELDAIVYRLELLPRSEGALLAFIRDERTQYDGTLRIVQQQSAAVLSALLSEAEQVEDPALAARIRKQCLRMQRMLSHCDFLHDPPVTEQLHLLFSDVAALCRDCAARVSAQIGRSITVHTPDSFLLLCEPDLLRAAVLNLLTNAVQASPIDAEIELSLNPDNYAPTITISDRGPGLDAHLFQQLLEGWQCTITLEDYRSITSKGALLGLGLPLVQRIALLHGGMLLFSPRQNGGSQFHLVLSHLPEWMADNNFHAPMSVEQAFTTDEIELSVF